MGTGEELYVDIYIGSVFYQRLRHMVSDKIQVRSTGPINQLTRQPIKGRQFGGGIRFGEMERDSLLAHGAAYLLHDRLHLSSDYCKMDCCRNCGSLLSSIYIFNNESNKIDNQSLSVLNIITTSVIITKRCFDGDLLKKIKCKMCKTSDYINNVTLPYVLKFLAIELASMNIKMRLEII